MGVTVNGDSAIGIGCGLFVMDNYSFVCGKYNKNSSLNEYAFVLGNGKDTNNRSNAHTVDWSGNAWYAGKVYVGADNDELATVKYINEKTAATFGSFCSSTLIDGITSSITIELAYPMYAINKCALCVEDTVLGEIMNISEPLTTASALVDSGKLYIAFYIDDTYLCKAKINKAGSVKKIVFGTLELTQGENEPTISPEGSKIVATYENGELTIETIPTDAAKVDNQNLSIISDDVSVDNNNLTFVNSNN